MLEENHDQQSRSDASRTNAGDREECANSGGGGQESKVSRAYRVWQSSVSIWLPCTHCR